MLEYYRDLAEQLAAMPGGHTRLREDFFATVTLPGAPTILAPLSAKIIEGWQLKGGGSLALIHNGAGVRLAWLKQDSEEDIADFPGELHAAASEFTITPIGLALLALAMGALDDGRLKKLLPDLHKASKSLLLIAVCRLCG